HTPHWHGLRVVEDGRKRTDVVELLPASMKVADMVADNAGTWLFHCHVAEHMMGGMFARMIVHPKGSPGAGKPRDTAFLGFPAARQSLRITHLEAALDFSPNAAQPCDLKMTGDVTVYNAFSVHTQAFRISIGEQTVSFKPDSNGLATVDG